MNWRDLIVIAQGLAWGVIPPRIGRPRQAELRRALSTIYYAAFHAFANNNANTLIGAGPQVRNDPAWELAYRAMDHGAARARCEHSTMSRFPAEIRQMAALFVRLQARRNRADYARQTRYRRSEVLQLATEMESAIQAFEAANLNRRRSFAAHLVFRERND